MSTEQTFASRTFASIPELLNLLTPDLMCQDLLQCVQVCRSWNQIFIPRLWQSIDDSSLSWPRFLGIQGPKGATGEQDDSGDFLRLLFHKYGQFIQQLDIHHRITIEAASNCTNWSQLFSLNIANGHSKNDSDDSKDNENSATMMQSIWRLVRQSPTLTTLRLDQSLPTPKTALTPASFMYDTLEKLLDLVELEINDSSAVFDKVLERLPKLERFRAPSRFELTGRDDSRLLHQTFTGIKELELFGEADTRAVFSVLRYLPNLESLQLPGGFNQEFYENDYIQAKEAKERMDNTPSRLKRLSVGHHGFMDSRILISILPWIRDLTHFCFEGIDSSLARALATECKQLEVIREVENLEGGKGVFHPRAQPQIVDSVLHLLKGCPRLKVLDTINHRIKGGNFMDCTLACLGLETFRCQIVGMYWLSEDSTHILDRILLSNASDTPITDDEQALLAEVFENQERYRKVYRQLSRLTELRVLDLGQEYRVPYHWDYVLNDNNVSDEGHPYQWYRSPIEETLDLTLVSGLGQLETLKELEVFGFEGVDHRMDRTELEWMAVHWPKLRVMRGIHVDILPRVEPDPKRTELREYMQMLRPDVIHETLFELPTKRRQ